MSGNLNQCGIVILGILVPNMVLCSRHCDLDLVLLAITCMCAHGSAVSSQSFTGSLQLRPPVYLFVVAE